MFVIFGSSRCADRSAMRSSMKQAACRGGRASRARPPDSALRIAKERRERGPPAGRTHPPRLRACRRASILYTKSRPVERGRLDFQSPCGGHSSGSVLRTVLPRKRPAGCAGGEFKDGRGAQDLDRGVGTGNTPFGSGGRFQPPVPHSAVSTVLCGPDTLRPELLKSFRLRRKPRRNSRKSEHRRAAASGCDWRQLRFPPTTMTFRAPSDFGFDGEPSARRKRGRR
jgi:hypothetical protein